MAIIEARKPKLPSGMKSLVSLWSNSAKVINAEGVDTIMGTIQAFDGYWGEDDLKKFLNIVQTLRKRTNITKERSNKLNTLNGRLRGLLPNKGSTSRSGLIRTNGTNTRTNLSTFMNKLNRLTPNNKKEYLTKLNASGSNFNVIKNAAYNVHRIRVFNSYINRAKLTSNQYNNFMRRIKNNEKLQNVVNEAKSKAPRNVSE